MAASAQIKTQTQTQTKPKRRKQHREITISASASASPPHTNTMPSSSSSSPVPTYPPTTYTNFNSALSAGLLNPMSPPPPFDKTRSSPTLFDMMSSDHEYHPSPAPPPHPDLLLQERLARIVSASSPNSRHTLFNDQESSDVRLTLTSKDSLLTLSLNLHRHVLAAQSRFFAAKLPDHRRPKPYIVDISDCDDIEAYVHTLRLMYSGDPRRRLMGGDGGGIASVLEILRVSAAIAFDDGVAACLEHLEAAPWAEDEEDKVAALLSELDLAGAASEVLKRVSGEDAASAAPAEEEAVVARLVGVVLEGKDEKARREMKGLMSKMLREKSGSRCRDDLSRDSLYKACNGCLRRLCHHFSRAAAAASDSGSGQIARQADNLSWILDILIDRQIADEFLQTWASQAELAELHPKVPVVHRYEVSRVSARLFVGIGKGQILVSKETRCLLLKTWLEPLYEDFGWMRRACKGLDRHSIEDGLGNTILTLPMGMQQEILMAWFHRFLNAGEDCPNIQRGFEVWWRRAFWKRKGEQERSQQQLRIAAGCHNGC